MVTYFSVFFLGRYYILFFFGRATRIPKNRPICFAGALVQENSEEVDWQKEADTPEGDDWKVKETWLELQGGAPVR